MKSDTEPRPINGWWEQDAYTGWRKYYSWGPGVLRCIKRRTHKRERAEAKKNIRKEMES